MEFVFEFCFFRFFATFIGKDLNLFEKERRRERKGEREKNENFVFFLILYLRNLDGFKFVMHICIM